MNTISLARNPKATPAARAAPGNLISRRPVAGIGHGAEVPAAGLGAGAVAQQGVDFAIAIGLFPRAVIVRNVQRIQERAVCVIH